MSRRVSLYVEFMRPFTLLVPATGMLSGGLMALGFPPRLHCDWESSIPIVLFRLLAGMLLGASLNVFSNGLNQICDLGMDRVNKPSRLLPSGRLKTGEAFAISIAALVLAFGTALWLGNQTLVITLGAAFLTVAYSAPPLRTKCRGFLANLTIAIPRGTLLVVAGWSTVKSVLMPEPWMVGGIMGAFFLGAVTTKDFSDIEGDRSENCRTLPIIFGVRRSIWITSPFFVLPFLAIVPLTRLGALTGNPGLLMVLGGGLACWGAYIVRLLLKTPPEDFSRLNFPGAENHPSWKHMYLLTLAAQCGFTVSYWL